MNYLVIGYGNTLRGDDGAGQRVAEQVNDWHMANVRSLSLHQLTPEIAADIAEAETIIFVDAITPTEEAVTQVQVTQLQAEVTPSQWAHYQNPRSLLLLAQKLYNKAPIAYQVTVPAENFAFGESLSATTEVAVKQALVQIRNLIGGISDTTD